MLTSEQLVWSEPVSGEALADHEVPASYVAPISAGGNGAISVTGFSTLSLPVTFTGTSLVVTVAAWSSLLAKYATVETETMTASGVLRVAIPACDALFIGVVTTSIDDYVIAARLSDSV